MSFNLASSATWRLNFSLSSCRKEQHTMKHVFVNLEFVRIEKISLIKTSHLFQQLDLLFQDMCCGRRRPSSFAQLSSQKLRLHFSLLERSPELDHLSLQPLEISQNSKSSVGVGKHLPHRLWSVNFLVPYSTLSLVFIQDILGLLNLQHQLCQSFLNLRKRAVRSFSIIIQFSSHRFLWNDKILLRKEEFTTCSFCCSAWFPLSTRTFRLLSWCWSCDTLAWCLLFAASSSSCRPPLEPHVK